MFGAGHLFGRRAGIREFGSPAELRRRKFAVRPLRGRAHDCPPIVGQLSHWRSDGKTLVTFTCGARSWEILFAFHEEIEDALRSAKKAARHWRDLVQAGSPLPESPTWPA